MGSLCNKMLIINWTCQHHESKKFCTKSSPRTVHRMIYKDFIFFTMKLTLVSRTGFKQIILTVSQTRWNDIPVVRCFATITQVPSRLSAGFQHLSQDLIETSHAKEHACMWKNMFINFLHLLNTLNAVSCQLDIEINRFNVHIIKESHAGVRSTSLGPKSTAMIWMQACNQRTRMFLYTCSFSRNSWGRKILWQTQRILCIGG